MNTGKLFHLAWRAMRYIPRPIGAAVFIVGADIAWLLHGKSIKRYEANLRRVRPNSSNREVRKLSRAGMRSYLRYYCEVFQLAGQSPEQIRARSNMANAEPLLADLANDKTVVAFLCHAGNWDLAGAICAQEIAPLTTVAERLEPEELYQEYLSFRTELGMNIIPLDVHEPGGGVFRQLIRVALQPGNLVALLADRDLTSRGVEVNFFGERARMAAGPAALALATGASLYPVYVRYERLHGERRKQAKGPWGIMFEFSPRLQPDAELSKNDSIVDLTQRTADFMTERISEHPEDWHMMQRIFVADLDPDRDALVRDTEPKPTTEEA